MGTWGPKLYQNDIAEEVRDYYKDQLHRGKTGKEITHELIEQYNDFIQDSDDAPDFWLALADIQWDYGRLEVFVKNQALFYISNEKSTNRWQRENPKYASTRLKELTSLQEKLLSEPPEEKKVRQYNLYKCKWNIGDIYAYQLCGGFAKDTSFYKKYVYFIKVDEIVWHPGHVIPAVYFYWSVSDNLLDINTLKEIEYIPQFFTPSAYKSNTSMRKLYLLSPLSTSSRVIPKNNLIYIGNLESVKRIVDEDTNPYYVHWRDFEEYIIGNFRKWNDYSPN